MAAGAPALLFSATLAAGGVVAWRDPWARPPKLPDRRPPAWGLPAAGCLLGALTAAGTAVVVRAGERGRGPAASAAIAGLSAAAAPGVLLLAFDTARRTVARRNRGRAGTVVVLGCALRGEEPSEMLRLRLDRAERVARRGGPGGAPTVVCCGGIGEDQDIAESTVMARWLTARGVADVVEEPDSTSTEENLANAAPLVPRGPVIVVTSDFHVFRTRALARRAGLGDWRVEGAATPTRYWSTSVLREFLALGVMWPAPGLAAGAAYLWWGMRAVPRG